VDKYSLFPVPVLVIIDMAGISNANKTTSMKILIPAIVILIIAVIGVFFYVNRGSAPSVAPTTPPSAGPAVPLPASSYGKGATGNSAGTPTTPSPTTKPGILEGMAKSATGAAVNFTSIKLSISDPKTNKELATVNLGADGSYKFTVEPGEYVLNVVPGTGSSTQLPQRIYVGSEETIDLNFKVK